MRILASISPIVVTAFALPALPAAPATTTLEQAFRFGEHIRGPELELEDLEGRVVLIEDWGIRCGACIASMPSLVKLQQKYGHTGFTVVGNHRQNAKPEQIRAKARELKINFTITDFGRVDVPRPMKSIPAAYLFDSEGNLVDQGHPSELKPRIVDLIESEPHWLAAGREYEHVGRYAEALKKTRAYGKILRGLERAARKDAAKEEAEFLMSRIRGRGKELLEKARSLEEENPYGAWTIYEDVAERWKGDEPTGDAAADRLKELKRDEDFRSEVTAGKVADKIRAALDEMVSVRGKLDPDYGPNRKLAARAKALYKALRKKFPDAQATERIGAELQEAGL